MTDNYLKSLARDYLDVIDMLKNAALEADERHTLESDRTVLHEQLISVIGTGVKREDMPNYCRKLLGE